MKNILKKNRKKVLTNKKTCFYIGGIMNDENLKKHLSEKYNTYTDRRGRFIIDLGINGRFELALYEAIPVDCYCSDTWRGLLNGEISEFLREERFSNVKPNTMLDQIKEAWHKFDRGNGNFDFTFKVEGLYFSLIKELVCGEYDLSFSHVFINGRPVEYCDEYGCETYNAKDAADEERFIIEGFTNICNGIYTFKGND